MRPVERLLATARAEIGYIEKDTNAQLDDKTANALFYLDPPYVNTEKYYDSPFSAQDHHRLREVLSQVKGRFILSYNDHPLIRELYADYRIEGITRTTTLAGKGNNQTQYAELIIRNF